MKGSSTPLNERCESSILLTATLMAGWYKATQLAVFAAAAGNSVSIEPNYRGDIVLQTITINEA